MHIGDHNNNLLAQDFSAAKSRTYKILVVFNNKYTNFNPKNEDTRHTNIKMGGCTVHNPPNTSEYYNNNVNFPPCGFYISDWHNISLYNNKKYKQKP